MNPLYHQQVQCIQALLQSNTMLCNYVHSCEQRLQQVEEDLKQVQIQNRKLTETIQTNREHLKKRTLAKQVKPYSDITRAAKFKRVHQMTDVFRLIAEDISPDVDIIKLHLSVEDHKDIVLCLRGEAPASTRRQRKVQEKREKLRRTHSILFVKDTHRISYKALHALRHQAGIKDIVSQNSLLLEAKRLSTCLPVVPLNVQSGDGFARSLTSVVEYHLSLPENRHLLKTADDEVTIWLRFACDSTKVNRCKNAVKAVCRLISTNHRERYNKTDSPEDEITLFLYMGKEDRPSLSEASRTIVEQMRTAATQGFPIRGKTVKVKWLFCSDWKTTALFKGINVASADYFCIWCYCTRDRISDFSGTEWKVERKAPDQALCLGANAEETKGYEAEDLLPFIPFDCVVPDELHLRMRITNKLLNQVVAWSVDHGLKDSLLREMSRLSVDFRFTEQEDGTGSITKWTQLTGEQLQKVFEKLDVSKVIDRKPRDVSNLHLLSTDILRRLVENRGRGKVPATWNKSDLVLHLYSLLSPGDQRSLVVVQTESSEESAMQLGSLPDSPDLPSPPVRLVDPASIQQLWRDFSALMQHMQSPPGPHETAEDNALRFHQAAKQWADKFRQETSDEDVIPYIHCMVYHVPEMLKNLHYVKDIGTAQLGRKNYEQHLVYFQGTNRQGGNKKKPVTQQILERENRLLDFRRRTSADPEQDGEADSDSDYEVDMQGSHDGPDADSADLDVNDLGDVPDTGDDHDHADAHDFGDAPDANLTGSDSDDDAN